MVKYKTKKEKNQLYLLSNKYTIADMPIKKKKLILTIRTVTWCPRLHKPSLIFLGGPTPFTIVKCVELAIDTASTSLVFTKCKFGSISMTVVSFVKLLVFDVVIILLQSCCWFCCFCDIVIFAL